MTRTILLCAVLLLGLLPAVGASAQQLRGTVQVGQMPIAGAPVILHRVTQESSGAVTQGRTDARGRFAFALPPVDTAGFTVFFVTSDYLGVRYFGPPLHPTDPRTGYVVAARDTMSVAPNSSPVQLARRDVVLLPDPQGGWEVNEILRIRNPAEKTLVARSGLGPWEMRLPDGVAAFEVGDGEIRADQVAQVGSRVFLLAPLVPGVHELFLRYRVPELPQGLRLRSGYPTDELNVLVRQPSPPLEVEGLAPGSPVRNGSETFLRYTARDLPADARVGLRARGTVAPPVSPPVAAAVAAALVLAAAAWVAVRRSGTDPVPEPGTSA